MKLNLKLFTTSFMILFFAALTLHIPQAIASWESTAEGNSERTAEGEAEEDTHIEKWLLLGPFPSPLPAFHEESRKKIDAAFLLSYEEMFRNKMDPVTGEVMTYLYGKSFEWQPVEADTDGVLIPLNANTPHIAYLATYINAPTWMKVEVGARATHPFEVTIDGTSVVKCARQSENSLPEDKKTGAAKLEPGTHLVIVKTVNVPGDTLIDWRLDVTMDVDGLIPELSLSPSRYLSVEDILEAPQMREAEISPDGSLIALHMSKALPPDGDAERWIEIRRFRDGELLRTITDTPGISYLQWAPVGKRLSYVTKQNGTGTVRVLDLETGIAESIVENVKELGSYTWSPDASFIVYSVTEKPEKDERGMKRLQGIYDKTNYGRNRSFLSISSVPGEATRRLTAGRYDSDIEDIHPDSGKLLISRHYEDLSARPYGFTELIRMNRDDQSIDLLWKGPWFRSASWSPDGRTILILAGPSSFGEIGTNVPEGIIPNDYDTQAYLFDPETKDVEPITKDFAPTINRAHWSISDGNIYFAVEEGSFGRMYRYNPKKKTFKRIDLGFDVIGRGSTIARERPLAALIGYSADHPARLYAADLRRGRATMILDPAGETLRHVKLGVVEDWNFTSTEGKIIQGRIHYPPDFDPDQMYSCIVYYYGGTSPTSRDFGGRYPKNLWAAMGYVVYVLQPSGATGYGQEFSAFHVNDWGKIVAEEIIEGTTTFLDAHQFVDRDRVGCIGASFGGFMTQLLITKTDIFAAAVSHAGISSISSYWGEGYWGALYNAVAAANSFPWNRPDIYIGQSPLFSADKINTPLLLLHGTSDTNVPPGESEQMYVALKLLGKDVEYVRVEGQNHIIMQYKPRKLWTKTIIAWFDRCLKDKPDWWNDLYPPGEPESVEKPKEIGMHRLDLGDRGTVLMGEVTRDDIVTHLGDWDAEYFEYTPDGEILSELEQLIRGIEITVVLGTWCSDSRRDVPRLWRILEDLRFPLSEVTMLAVGSSRFNEDMPIPPQVLEWSNEVKSWYGVERVATLIIKREGKEIGRIVESPQRSLEGDLLEILRERKR